MMKDEPIDEFECPDCGHKFGCGIVNIETNTICCPKCKTEIMSDTDLYEYECVSDV